MIYLKFCNRPFNIILMLLDTNESSLLPYVDEIAPIMNVCLTIAFFELGWLRESLVRIVMDGE